MDVPLEKNTNTVTEKSDVESNWFCSLLILLTYGFVLKIHQLLYKNSTALLESCFYSVERVKKNAAALLFCSIMNTK